jgi:glutathione S-transferase
MTIEFYWMPGGPFALRCLMTLAAKGLPYESHQLDVAKQENRTPAFLAMSPSGTLPVLKDGATIVRESQAIMFYLDRAYPALPLYGEHPGEAGSIMQEICEQQSYAEPILNPLIGVFFFKRAMSAADIAPVAHRFVSLLQDVDARLAATGWLAGAKMSAADINLYPLIQAVLEGHKTEKARELDLRAPPLDSLANITSWMQRLRVLAGVEH